MRRSLTWYWRGHLAVALGAAVASAVLVGALVVGDSTRASLTALVLDRLGTIDQVTLSTRPHGAALADDLERAAPAVRAAPALLVRGSARHGESGARASGVSLLGIDSRFGDLYPDAPALDLGRRDGLFPPVALSGSLARELGATVGETVLLSFERPSDIPREMVVGRREESDLVETLRLTVDAVLPDRGLGGFSLATEQGRPLNAFVARDRLQRTLFGSDAEPRANLVAVSGLREAQPLAAALRGVLTAEDLGLRLLPGARILVVESRAFVLDDRLTGLVAEIAAGLGAAVQPALASLATRLEHSGRSVPYSSVLAIDPPAVDALGPWRLLGGEPMPTLGAGEALLNAWTAEQLAAGVGDEVTVGYWELGEGETLREVEARFRVRGVLPMEGAGLDRRLVPDFPGIQDAEDMAGWNPPFPVDLDRIRPRDEEYWDRYRAAPKLVVGLARGRELWGSRYGDSTSLRLAPPPGTGVEELEAALRSGLPGRLADAGLGLELRALRLEGLEAARGATDFAQLFLGLSLFLIAAAVMLVGLLFRLLVEGRAAEVGLLAALGFTGRRIRRRFLLEGGVVAALGAAGGCGLGVAYARLLLHGLSTSWLPAIGTPVLELHVGGASLAIGWLGALATVLVAMLLALRGLRSVAVPQLLRGETAGPSAPASRRPARVGWTAGAIGIGAAVAAFWTGSTATAALAFLTGAAGLVAGLASFAVWSGREASRPGLLRGAPLWALGSRNSGRNRGRSLLAVSLVGSAAFVLAVVAANRTAGNDGLEGAGGFALVAESEVPVFGPLESDGAGEPLGTVVPFRLRPGDDVSCLNLLRPQEPRVLGVPLDAIEARGDFRIQSAIDTEGPPSWDLLREDLGEGAVPAFADYNSALWILHKGLGDDVEITDEAGRTTRLRLVGLLAKGIFQSELLISEERFRELFPSREGHRFFLIDAPPDRVDAAAAALERRYRGQGLDATSAAERLAAFHAVESTYLATFQTLGGLGLLLGTLGLGIVVLRNVLERRAELAVLTAFGFSRARLAALVLVENATLLLLGLGLGTAAGLLAAAPRLLTAGEAPAWSALLVLLPLVFATGMLASIAAVRAVLRMPLLESLRSG
jgi:ABC-type lipoprotein release transport system permease subunit